MLRGDFQTAGLPDIINIIVQNGRTGLLTIVKEDDEKSIYFLNGKIVSASSRQADHLLGNILLSKNYITKNILDEAMQFKRDTGLQLGEILKKMGAVNEEIIKEALSLQIEEIFVSLFQWVEAEFSFIDMEISEYEVFQTNVDATKLILDTARRIDEWNEIKRIIPKTDKVLKIKIPKEKKKITREEFEILNHIKNKKTIKYICQISKKTEIDTLKVIYKLIKKGIVEY